MKRVLCFLMALTALLMMTAGVAAADGTELASTAGEPAPGIANFHTTDLNGEPFTQAYFAENGVRLILLNLWEPWCGPCVGEMPELQKLYETYRDRGFAVVGAFSYEDTEATRALAEEMGITYPIIRHPAEFDGFCSDYVPTSAFLLTDGTVLEEQIIGSRSYAEWEKLVLQYLN